jgi:uncharacterized protein (TIGR03435 family)
MNNIPQVLVAVLNSIWQAALVAALVWFTLRFLPRTRVSVNAATRYVIWWATLAVVVLLPAAPSILHSLRTRPQPSAQTTVKTTRSPRPQTAPSEPATAIVMLEDQPSSRWPLWILALWASVFLFRMIQIARSYFYLCGVKRRSSIAGRELPSIARTAQLLLSEDIASPMAVGFWRPAVILPTALPDQLETAELEHVLLHETAHIARKDDWTNLAGRVLGAALALHPVAVWILRQIEREREMACDDWVVARTGAAKPYAASLARMFEMRWSRRKDPPHLKLASGIFGGRGRVSERIEILLTRRPEFSAQVSLARVTGSAIVLLVCAAAGSFAPGWITFAQQLPAFEVTSVKPNRSGSERFTTSMPPHTSMFKATNINMKTLMLIAYSVDAPRILGGPEWIDSDRFDIVARPPQGTSEVAQSRLMLQTLLADRFKLRIRHETKEIPVYALVAPKTGVKFADAEEGNCAEAGPNFPPPGPVPGQTPPLPCGAFLLSPTVLAGSRVSMAEFVRVLANHLDRPVIDKTGYTGTLSFRLEFTPEGLAALPSDAQNSNLAKPSLFTIVQEQLGLKLESQRGAAEVLVIDHVEKPDAN